MTLIERELVGASNKYRNMWLADTDSDIPANFDPDSAVGSVIMVIATQETWMKNSQGKWQKCGTTEVRA